MSVRRALMCLFFGGFLVACAKPVDRAIDRGNAAARDGHLDDARTAYAEAVAAEPGSAKAHLLLGNALMSLNKDAEALAEFRAAQALPAAREALASVALHDQDAGAAIGLLGTDDSAEAKVIRGRALLALGRPAEALEQVALVPSIQGQYVRGSALVVLHRWADAQASFDALERAAPTSPFGAYGLARLAAAQGRAADALLYLKAAKSIWGPGWSADVVSADAAFAFLVASTDYQELLKPAPPP